MRRFIHVALIVACVLLGISCVSQVISLTPAYLGFVAIDITDPEHPGQMKGLEVSLSDLLVRSFAATALFGTAIYLWRKMRWMGASLKRAS